jgi:hypothetical protein
VKKPSAGDVATLQKGQFYVCWSTHAVKTYVQPAWMEGEEARRIARGEIAMPAARWVPPRIPATPITEVTVNEQEARALRQENEDLRRQVAELTRRLGGSVGLPLEHAVATAPATDAQRPSPIAYEVRDAKTRDLVDESMDDRLYRLFRKRLLEEEPAALLRVLTSRPELEVQVQREVVRADGKSLRGRIGRMVVDGFFAQARTSADVLAELERRGSARPSNIELGNELKALAEMGFFTRENKWLSLVPDMKVNVVEV